MIATQIQLSQMNKLAEALDIDPVALRLHNLVGDGDPMPWGKPLPDDARGLRQSLIAAAEAIGWRRDGNKPAPAIKRTAELEVLMAHSDFAKAGNTFSYNYKGTPVTCFRRKKVNLPDWSVMPVVKPTTFDLILPFDMP